jgi:carboxyl-terminal processing protease
MGMKVGTTALAALLMAGAAPPNYPAKIRTLGKTVSENFYDPHLRGVNWVGVTRDYERRAMAVRDDAEFKRLATEMMGTLKASHTDITLPSSNSPQSRPPLVLERDVIVEVAELSHARAQGLRPGFRLLDEAKLAGPLGTLAEVRVRDCAGVERTVVAKRESALWPPPEPTFRWRKIRTAPGTTLGYLKVDAFDDDGAALSDQAMEALKNTTGLVIDLRSNQGGNASALRLASYFTGEAGPGLILLGRDYLQKLGRTPTSADARRAPRADRAYTTAKVGEALKANGGAAALWTEDLGPKRYEKPVVVLIGPETASAAEGFAWVMKLRSKAKLVGRRSQAALLSADRLEFAAGWHVRVPTAGVWAPDGQDYGDRAIHPDVAVSVDAAALCEGRDPALEQALEIVERSSSSFIK